MSDTSGVKLEKTRTVLNNTNSTPDTGPRFCYMDDEGVGRVYVLYMDLDVWDDMGKPDTITVTIEPGDLLNT